MLPLSKRVQIAIAVTLGLALAVPLPVAAFANFAKSRPKVQNKAVAAMRSGDLVRVRSGGPLMTVTSVQGDQVKCSWTDWVTGELKSETFPVAVLSVPVSIPPSDPKLEQDERNTDAYYKKHCPSGSVSIEGQFTCAY